MNTSYTAVPFLSHRLEPKSEAGEDVEINVKAYVVRPGSTGSPLSFDFSFSAVEFIHEDDESPGKLQLYYFLMDSGIEDEEAQFMIVDLVLKADDVMKSIDDGFRGVLTLTLIVLFRPVELNRAGSDERTGGEEDGHGGGLFRPVELIPVKGKIPVQTGEPVAKTGLKR